MLQWHIGQGPALVVAHVASPFAVVAVPSPSSAAIAASNAAASLTDSGVFVLDAGAALYQWRGRRASRMEACRAPALCRASLGPPASP